MIQTNKTVKHFLLLVNRCSCRFGHNQRTIPFTNSNHPKPKQWVQSQSFSFLASIFELNTKISIDFVQSIVHSAIWDKFHTIAKQLIHHSHQYRNLISVLAIQVRMHTMPTVTSRQDYQILHTNIMWLVPNFVRKVVDFTWMEQKYLLIVLSFYSVWSLEL